MAENGIIKGGREAFEVDSVVGVWRVVVTAPRKEGVVVAQLPPHLYDVYRPVALEPRRLNGRGSIGYVPRSLFPNYLFVRQKSTTAAPLREKIGINFLFQNAVTDEVISRLRSLERDGVIKLFSKENVPPDVVRIGEEVSALDGLIKLVVTDVDPQNRVSALSTMLGRECKFVITPEKLRRSQP